MKRFCIFLAAAVSVFNVSAGVRMPRFFSDNMVLQRDMPVRVWGRASAGDTVEVRLGETAAAAVADSSGRWLAELPSMQPGGPGNGEPLQVAVSVPVCGPEASARCVEREDGNAAFRLHGPENRA